jgi:hypothetical protein
MARPKLKIDDEQVRKLAAINCTNVEMASVLGCDVRTLERRFAATIKDGRAHGVMSLKRKQYEVAMNGNIAMLIWLGKQLMGQTDKHEWNLQNVPEEKWLEETERRLGIKKTSSDGSSSAAK